MYLNRQGITVPVTCTTPRIRYKSCYRITVQEGFCFMARIFLRDGFGFWRKGSTVFLALCYLLGLFCGAVFCILSGYSISSLMRSVPHGAVSIVDLLSVTALPFLLSAFAVFISEPRLIFFICFGKAFLFCVISLGISEAFGSAGWLVRWLSMFSDIMGMPVLYLYWLRILSSGRKPLFGETFVFASLIFLIGSIDFCLITPLLAGLIHFLKG